MKSSHFSSFSVLIVDDEKLINKLVHDVLTSLGFTDITVANTGNKAIELVVTKKFDFIITDWRMNDFDGIDLVRFVRSSPESQHPTTPIIMLTGNTEAHYVITALNAGINGYLIKPFSAEQLVRRIRNIIEQPRPFVFAPQFKGPDRRHTNRTPPGNVERRTSSRKVLA